MEIVLSKFCSSDDIITKVNRINSDVAESIGGRKSQNYLDSERPYYYGLRLRDNITTCVVHNLRQLVKLIPFSQNVFSYQDKPSFRSWVWKKENQKYLGHMPASVLRKYLGGDTFDSFKKVTIIRNPFDQIVSWYFWRNATGGKSVEKDFSTFIKNNSKDFFYSNQIVIAIDNSLTVDEVVRYEYMEEDLGELTNKLGFPESLPTLFANLRTNDFTRIRPNYDIIDANSRDEIVRNGRFFFERFGYSTSIPN